MIMCSYLHGFAPSRTLDVRALKPSLYQHSLMIETRLYMCQSKSLPQRRAATNYDIATFIKLICLANEMFFMLQYIPLLRDAVEECLGKCIHV